MELHIFPAGEQDLPAISRLMETAALDPQHPGWFCWDGPEFLRRHLAEEGFLLKAVADHAVAGFLMVRFPGRQEDNLGFDLGLSPGERDQVAHMESVVVLPRYRGHGIQKTLLRAAEDILAPLPYRRYLATVHPQNLPSLRSFQALGYEILRTTVKYGGLSRHIVGKIKF